MPRNEEKELENDSREVLQRGMKKLLIVMYMFITWIVVMVTQAYAKMIKLYTLNYVQFILCQSYFGNKPLFKKNQLGRLQTLNMNCISDNNTVSMSTFKNVKSRCSDPDNIKSP